MTGIAVGNCPRCGAAASYFARSCPHCHASNLPNPVAAVAALSAVLVAGGLIALGWWTLRGEGEPQSSPAAAPAAESKSDYGWLITAMAECEAQAKVKSDAVHFLIVPVTATGISLPGWSPGVIGKIGDAVTLLQSTDALIGLRNGALALYSKPVTLALSEPESKTVYKWKPTVGVTALTSREIGSGGLAIGLDIPDVANEIAWGPTINLTKGSCYWINALVAAPARGR
ncbi:MAG: hypothetical protein WBW74_22140 [Xanthobacteraceae bacterium]